MMRTKIGLRYFSCLVALVSLMQYADFLGETKIGDVNIFLSSSYKRVRLSISGIVKFLKIYGQNFPLHFFSTHQRSIYS